MPIGTGPGRTGYLHSAGGLRVDRLAAIPLVVAVVALAVIAACVHRGGVGLVGPAAVAGATSAGWTIGTTAFGWPPLPPCGLFEPAASCALVALLACYAPAGWRSTGAGVLVGAAATAESLRRLNRLELARDLHDYVAHNVSDMLASVQAARFLGDAGTGTERMLTRAEAAGQRAMTSLDHVVAALHDPSSEAADRPAPGLHELPALVEQFNGAGGERARLVVDVDPHVVPREPSALAYRLVVESLTNVRRHASRGTRVDVLVTALDGSGIRVSVRDTGPARRTSAATRSGGTGIAGLRARVEALGGALSAGPAGSGWTVDSTLPFAPGGGG